MKNKRGFTLIEVLVVVLIIGILSAVAVPQYQKAVLKSRFSSLMPLARALNESNERYYMEHGNYTDDSTDLDVITSEVNTEITLGDTPTHQYVKLTRSDMNNNLLMYQKHSPSFAGEIHCEADNTDHNAVWLCSEGLQGTLIPGKTQPGYVTYVLEGSGVGNAQAVTYENVSHTNLDNGDSCIASDSSGYGGCRAVNATNGSTCIANVYGGCSWDLSVSNQSRSSFNNSTCIGNSTYGCIYSTFANNSKCEGNFWNGSCGLSTYKDYSYCVGNAAPASNGKNGVCSSSRFQNYSYCVANAAGACANNTYLDNTSYCTSESGFCPVDSPKQGGGTWQLCEGEEEGGKTC